MQSTAKGIARGTARDAGPISELPNLGSALKSARSCCGALHIEHHPLK